MSWLNHIFIIFKNLVTNLLIFQYCMCEVNKPQLRCIICTYISVLRFLLPAFFSPHTWIFLLSCLRRWFSTPNLSLICDSFRKLHLYITVAKAKGEKNTLYLRSYSISSILATFLHLFLATWMWPAICASTSPPGN